MVEFCSLLQYNSGVLVAYSRLEFSYATYCMSLMPVFNSMSPGDTSPCTYCILIYTAKIRRAVAVGRFFTTLKISWKSKRKYYWGDFFCFTSWNAFSHHCHYKSFRSVTAVFILEFVVCKPTFAWNCCRHNERVIRREADPGPGNLMHHNRVIILSEMLGECLDHMLRDRVGGRTGVEAYERECWQVWLGMIQNCF